MSYPNPRMVRFVEGTYLVYFEPDAMGVLNCKECEEQFLGEITFKAVRVMQGEREVVPDNPDWQRAADQAVREENEIQRAYLEGAGGPLCARCKENKWDNAP